QRAINPQVIADFFRSELGEKLLHANQVLRELPFSYGLPVQRVYPNSTDRLQGETVLVQGVIDCLFEYQGQWILLDYKTDRVWNDPLEIAKRYQLQISLYAEAIEAIWRRPVKEKYIFLFDGAHMISM